MSKQKILLHICCAPCGSASVERLLQEDKEITLFFSNSNINSHGEFEKRLDSVKYLAKFYRLRCFADDYNHGEWLSAIRGFEGEPEKGGRCGLCFNHSLTKTAIMARKLQIQNFTTTLTISPHKVSRVIFEQGMKHPGFLPYDFKKKDGFKRSIELSKELGLYRQGYCGCEFSMQRLKAVC